MNRQQSCVHGADDDDDLNSIDIFTRSSSISNNEGCPSRRLHRAASQCEKEIVLHRCAIDSETLYLVSISIAFTSLWWYGGRGFTLFFFLPWVSIHHSNRRPAQVTICITHRQTQHTHTLHTGAERPFVTVNNVRTPHRLNNVSPFLP